MDTLSGARDMDTLVNPQKSKVREPSKHVWQVLTGTVTLKIDTCPTMGKNVWQNV